ncbi:NAD-dependent epimerase/dehydratase family protein [Micromonospora sp. KC606]|uniref:NAD(P)-dependent oxidoreductase n=1 Tax=Micromonospora sp. KC606 TaxID=2530379 RepID=UPI00104FD0FB|nr:NAD(P)H-binding protein [Micromonospora sp. KC606]TDC85972.1 NAD-dependent epimerase/dehydratase family protein [Micromonospora sp. KC606]
MRIAVVGANGRTGRLVVEQALARGYDVIALARRPRQSTPPDRKLSSVSVDALDRERVVEGLYGVDAVISALGIGTSREPTVTYSEGTANLLYAMGRQAIRRIVVISASPVGPRQDQSFFDRHVVVPVLERFFGATYQDMRRMEALLAASDTDWTSLRPPRLLEKPATGNYRLDVSRPLPKGRTLTYADLATALLDAVNRDDLRRRPAYVAN